MSVLRASARSDASVLAHLRKQCLVVDAVGEAMEDLFRIEFPFITPHTPEYSKTLQLYLEREIQGQSADDFGVWVHYPWQNTLVHLPDEQDYFRLRTSRNQFLITAEEQETFYNSCIGIAGLSVGFSILRAIILSGGSKHTRIADPDTLSITNLNRLPASICNLGMKKTAIASRAICEINPFQEIQSFPAGLQETEFDEFFLGKRKLDVFLEEMDDIRLKIVSRFRARSLGIPVVMATDNGDNCIIDVERFDEEPERPIFHGRVDEKEMQSIPHVLSQAEKVRLANAIVGPDVTPRMQTSLTMVGTKLVSWPQLGNAATLSAAATSYVVRRIVTGQVMPSGKYEVSLDGCLDVTYPSESEVTRRAQARDDFVKGFELLFGGPSNAC